MGQTSKILIGTSGFSYPDWVGTLYPKDLKKRKIHELEYLSEFYDFCEINNTFYRPLAPNIAQKWCWHVRNNKDYAFTAKLTEVFTHAPGRGNKKSSSAETIKYNTQDIEDAKRGFEPLANAGKLGALLLQFPISFKYTEGNWDHLIDVIHLFREYPLAAEVRHKTWLDPLVLKALRDENVAFCNIDQTRLGETLEGTDIVTASLAYLRLHGRSAQWFTAKNRDARYDYLYSKSTLQKIKGKIEKMAGEVNKTYVAANNHPRGQAAANATELKSLFAGKKVKASQSLIESYPALEEFAIPNKISDSLLHDSGESPPGKDKKERGNEKRQTELLW